ncbi:AraC-like DNA-binding protein [Novosphingobium kunmingense]|uniref:AraC-like DNA-binding protein n=1 Tax=Novosphingobium kunmingense TaxID=1211806 RepID=A0A2N0H6R8_9SPHN|nr:AraC-like DNA-binding protein [Novosphingobium kunmingense]
MTSCSSVQVRFHTPPDDLRPYFTTFYCADLDPGDDETLVDSLHPEWAGLRFFSSALGRSWFEGGKSLDNARFVATGPSSHPLHFVLPRTRLWGIGLLPLGWAKFIGQPASDCANLVCDGNSHPALSHLVPLAGLLHGGKLTEMEEVEAIAAFFRRLDRPELPDHQRITDIHAAIVDPTASSVHDLVDLTGLGQRTIERLCLRHFGFSPKVLLRRQRFMRSLAQFMLDPSLKWIGALDSHYHDQAQFVREFHAFMGVTPGEYAAQPHPVLSRFVQERARSQGAAVQTLDRPAGASKGQP